MVWQNFFLSLELHAKSSAMRLSDVFLSTELSGKVRGLSSSKLERIFLKSVRLRE